MNLGNALLKQHRLAEAAKAFARAVELDPQNADAMNNLAYTYCEMGENLDEAAKLCKRAAALFPARKAYFSTRWDASTSNRASATKRATAFGARPGGNHRPRTIPAQRHPETLSAASPMS